MARSLVGSADELPTYRRVSGIRPSVSCQMGSAGAMVRIDKARRQLGYQPVLTRQQAIDLTWKWVEHARIC
jgi:hypothetical protein